MHFSMTVHTTKLHACILCTQRHAQSNHDPCSLPSPKLQYPLPLQQNLPQSPPLPIPMPNNINQPAPPLPPPQKRPTLPRPPLRTPPPRLPHTPPPLAPNAKRLLHPRSKTNLLNHRRRRYLLPRKRTPRHCMHRVTSFGTVEAALAVAGVEADFSV